MFISGFDQLDIAYWHRGLWGISYDVDCEVWGPLDAMGFVCDFSVLKAFLRSFLKEFYDHRFVAPTHHPLYSLIPDTPGSSSFEPDKVTPETLLTWSLRNSSQLPTFQRAPRTRALAEMWSYTAPSSAILPLPSAYYHHDLLERHIESHALTAMKEKRIATPDGLHLTLRPGHHSTSCSHSHDRESDKGDAQSQTDTHHHGDDIRTMPPPGPSSKETVFHYTHGVAAHRGLCHRLWHGHSSRLEIRINGQRDHHLESQVVHQFFHTTPFHIAEPSQILSGHLWPRGECGPSGEMCELGYQGLSGEFRCTMPAERIYLIAPATSVECFAQTVARELKKSQPQNHIDVRIFEGIRKGGIGKC